ncbi:hypothetical protein EX30DRAFT_208959 [Ascodesmis nigricans]|uniref:Uncharacterized protein n=1 Tax=Ascodesmis nigricans TaxID=341454 RepID=A0A4S2MR83_9PEZI|nr:hypothetical protein EX30DRAFT_208959 [Ascodesmis nigricans]
MKAALMALLAGFAGVLAAPGMFRRDGEEGAVGDEAVEAEITPIYDLCMEFPFTDECFCKGYLKSTDPVWTQFCNDNPEYPVCFQCPAAVTPPSPGTSPFSSGSFLSTPTLPITIPPRYDLQIPQSPFRVFPHD